jgi:hypothetical protein
LLVRLLPLILASAVSVVAVHAQTPLAAEEYRLKAVVIVRFPQFVEWPPGLLEASDSFRLCVVTPNPFGAVLGEFTRGETVKGRPIVVRDLRRDQPVSGCHLLFIPRSIDARPLIERATASSVLTVGEGPAFLDANGIIGLRLVERHVKFEVNVAAAARARLTVSSQLLALAAAVRGGP